MESTKKHTIEIAISTLAGERYFKDAIIYSPEISLTNKGDAQKIFDQFFSWAPNIEKISFQTYMSPRQFGEFIFRKRMCQLDVIHQDLLEIYVNDKLVLKELMLKFGK